MFDLVSAYFAEIVQTHERGDATEHTYRPALKTLVETFDPNIIATNEPARQRCGAPDYILTKNNRPLGYIEAKTIGKNLDSTEYQEQFDRYLAALSNLIITDYLRFQFWQNGNKIAEVSIGELKNKTIHPLKENFGEFENLLREFCHYKGAIIHSAHDLASLLAGKAKLLADTIRNALTIEERSYANTTLQEQLESFRKMLIPDMSVPMYADLYAQTIAYGMFAGRLHHKTADTFTRHTAAETIPKSHPFLRKLFSHIAGPDIDDRIRWVIDELADLLQVANIKLIMEDFGKATKTEDATIHFYEDFLTAYNPDLRKSRGVFYTPQPAVGYIVRAVDEILQQDFKLRDGIADNTKVVIEGQKFHQVQILDPATGTGTFLAEMIRQVHAKIVKKNMQGAWNNYVANDLLPRLHGFEILMAPYAMAHLKLDMILEDTGYRFDKDQRVSVYLTNALDGGIRPGAASDYLAGFVDWLVHEARESHRIKQKMPIMVVIGNPPYNVSTMNRNEFSSLLISQYKEGLGEKKTNLDDDYIKFIALGQRFIDRNNVSGGILAYISNNSFLDGVTHRNMRKSLLKTFDKIYVLNLHGNARKKETAPDGSKDDNVFNIMQGTSINIFVRTPKRKEDAKGRVFYLDLYGKRAEKYQFLETKSLKTTRFAELDLSDQFYSFFAPKDFSARKKYDKGFSVTELFIQYNSGIQTDRDSLFIDHDKDVLATRMKKLLSGDYDWRFEDKFRIVDSSGYKLTQAIKNKKFDSRYLQEIAYRPFDHRWIYYDPTIISRPGFKAMQHLLGNDNFCLTVSRQVKLEEWNHVYISDGLVERGVNFCGGGSGAPIIAPLYIYPDNYGLIAKRGFDEPNAAPAFVSKHIIDRRVWTRPGMQGAEQMFPLYLNPPQEKRQPNLNSQIVAKIEHIIGKKVKPEKLFDYIYAVLHSPKYRKDYAEFLKIDFPKIPYPVDNTEFERLAKFGQRLRELHLLEKIPKMKTTFPIADGNVVENIRFIDGKVFINKTQYFGNVPASAWEFYIGGYQPLQKYLKDRKGRVLTFEEIQHYQKVVAALAETIEIMKQLAEPQS